MKYLSVSMRLLLAFSFAAFTLTSAAAASETLSQSLDIRLFPKQQQLRGKAVLQLQDPDVSRLELLLAPSAEIREVLLDGRPVPHKFQGGRLRLSLPEDRARKIQLTIAYRANFNDPVPERPAHNEDPTYGVSATITPQGTFLGGGTGWYPATRFSPTDFRLRIEAPPGYLAVTEGQLQERKTDDKRSVSVWRIDRPGKDLTLSAGPYEIRERRSGTIPVYTFFYPDSDDLADTYLRAATEYLDLYRKLFGPYPFSKFAVVENFFPTGYGFPSWTLLGSTVVRLPFIVRTSLGHEVAHSWWGNGVEVDYSRGNWSEGLTTYVADHLYKERSSAEEARQYRLKILRDYAALVPPAKDYPLTEFRSRRSKIDQALGYGKSAMVFHMARRRVGDEAFWRALRQVAQNRMFEPTNWSDFARALAETGDEDLGAFFRQWTRRADAPELRLAEISSEKKKDEWQVNGVLVQEGEELYDLRVPVRVKTAAGEKRRIVHSRDRRTPFALTAETKPQLLEGDPDVDIFRRLDPVEIPPTVNGIRGSDSLLVVSAADADPEVIAAARKLLAAFRQKGVPVVPENAVSSDQLASHDLLLVGRPQTLELDLPESLQTGPASFRLHETTYDAPGHALFAALPHPLAQNRVAALFQPLSPDAARAAYRKIPHYGKYSYLVFESGHNRAKGTWTIKRSPLIHHFDDKGEGS